MEEMHTPKDFPKSIFALGGIQIVIYTMVGALGVSIPSQRELTGSTLSSGPRSSHRLS
jgi:hypothetical protein